MGKLNASWSHPGFPRAMFKESPFAQWLAYSVSRAAFSVSSSLVDISTYDIYMSRSLCGFMPFARPLYQNKALLITYRGIYRIIGRYFRTLRHVPL